MDNGVPEEEVETEKEVCMLSRITALLNVMNLKECTRVPPDETCSAMPIQSKIDAFCTTIVRTSNQKHSTDADKENTPPAKRRRKIILESESDDENMKDGSVIQQSGHQACETNTGTSTNENHAEETLTAATQAMDTIKQPQHGDGGQVSRVPRTIHTETVTVV